MSEIIKKEKKSEVSDIIKLSGRLYTKNNGIRTLHKNNNQNKRFHVKHENRINKEYKTIIYKKNNMIIGYCKFHIKNIMLCNKICIIEQLTINEEYKFRGIEKKIINQIKEYAKNCSCNSIEIKVNYENYDAVNFYSLSGFVPKTYKLKFNLNSDKH